MIPQVGNAGYCSQKKQGLLLQEYLFFTWNAEACASYNFIIMKDIQINLHKIRLQTYHLLGNTATSLLSMQERTYNSMRKYEDILLGFGIESGNISELVNQFIVNYGIFSITIITHKQ